MFYFFLTTIFFKHCIEHLLGRTNVLNLNTSTYWSLNVSSESVLQNQHTQPDHINILNQTTSTYSTWFYQQTQPDCIDVYSQPEKNSTLNLSLINTDSDYINIFNLTISLYSTGPFRLTQPDNINKLSLTMSTYSTWPC